MGRMCIDVAMETHDARQAHMQHEGMQEMSYRKRCNSGELLQELVTFCLEDHNGTRMSFLKEWCHKHYRLKELGGKTCDCEFVHSNLQTALRSDNRLTDAFLAFQPTDEEDLDIVRLKDIMIRAASLHNARDQSKNKP